MKFKRGELYRLKADAVGKQRPVVIVSCDDFNEGPDLLIVKFFSQQVKRRTDDPACAVFYRGEGGLTEDCMAMPGYLVSIKKADLQPGRVGSFDANQMDRLMNAVKWVIGLEV